MAFYQLYKKVDGNIYLSLKINSQQASLCMNNYVTKKASSATMKCWYRIGEFSQSKTVLATQTWQLRDVNLK